MPDNLNTYSLKSEVHAGLRDINAYRKRDTTNQLVDPDDTRPFLNEYINIEARVHLTAVWVNGTTTDYTVRSRMTYNDITKETQLTLSPYMDMEECGEQLLENICNCE
jgi:hypothetical protein